MSGSDDAHADSQLPFILQRLGRRLILLITTSSILSQTGLTHSKNAPGTPSRNATDS